MCFAPQNQTSTCEDKVRLFYAIKTHYNTIQYNFGKGTPCKHINHPKTTLGGRSLNYIQPFQILQWVKNYGSYTWASVYKTQAHYLSLSLSWHLS